MALDLTKLLTEPPTDPTGYKYVVAGSQAGWLPVSTEDRAQRTADMAVFTAGAKARLKAYAAEKRWKIESGGCPWNGFVIATDRESQAKLIAEFVAVTASIRPDPSPWKMADGSFVDLTNAQMTTAAVAARAHIATAFAIEKTLCVGIDNSTITSAAQIDAAAWPVNV